MARACIILDCKKLISWEIRTSSLILLQNLLGFQAIIAGQEAVDWGCIHVKGTWYMGDFEATQAPPRDNKDTENPRKL